MKLKAKIAILSAMVACLAGALWLTGSRPSLRKLTYSQFLKHVRVGQVESVIVIGGTSATEAICRLTGGETVRTVLPSDYREAMAAMEDKLVNIEIQDSSAGSNRPLLNAAPFLLLLGIWVFFFVRKFPSGPFTAGSTSRPG